jgi:hypothetical protein
MAPEINANRTFSGDISFNAAVCGARTTPPSWRGTAVRILAILL